MRRKLGKTELLALLAAAGVTTCAAQAAKIDSNTRSTALQVVDQPANTQLGSGKDSACGKGACGTDESGAKAAQAKRAAEAKKAPPATKAKKTPAKKQAKKTDDD